jgi:hypothetical protein
MERETGIEPTASSLGSCRRVVGQRRIKHLERVMWGRKWHYRRLLNTLLNTTFLVLLLSHIKLIRLAWSCLELHRAGEVRPQHLGSGSVSVMGMLCQPPTGLMSTNWLNRAGSPMSRRRFLSVRPNAVAGRLDTDSLERENRTSAGTIPKACCYRLDPD